MPPPILTESIKNISISEAFSAFLIEKEFQNLHEVVILGVSQLQNMPGFTVHFMEELLNILDEHQCLHLLNED